ncbi:KAP family P-loop domain protein [Streptococcus oralis]|uniref:KAP family P-loop domain protein n=1 Tax=Streptococcus oralis TaxID=1303 RepID=A0A3R9LER0_STROR|nr:P-loop NTPase fold protein [Streptococcus oralis]RSJ70188.1 KAP family P-loop domain protein [Streptococcus oralis]
MTENNFIELDKIETSTAAQNFVNLLNENKTYFLNGTWGSGKSTFLNEVDDIKQIKLVTIDFWRLNDSRSTLETVFAKLHPCVYWGLRLIVILCIALSILMTNVVDLGLSAYVPNWVVLSAGVIALIVAIHQFLKIKSDGIYSWLLTRKCFSFKRKVLVVDDFDRMTNIQQEASYKLFSLLNGKLPIIFVGDIELLHRNDNNYLSKIIDRRIELPYDLHPNKIWSDYIEQLEKKFKIKLSGEVKSIFILDTKNLRDRERFNDFVNLELIKRNKKEYVQIEQQLIVIFFYLYYPTIYEGLKSGKEQTLLNDKIRPFIESLYKKLTEKNDFYPSCYVNNNEAYFINETPSNRTVDELSLIIDSNQQLSKELLIAKPKSDFFHFVIGNFEILPENQQELLFLQSLELSTRDNNNDLMDFIIQKRIEKEIPDYKIGTTEVNNEMIGNIFSFFQNLLQDMIDDPDTSEVYYFILKHKIFRYQDLRVLEEELGPYDEEYLSYRRKYVTLLIYLYRRDEIDFFNIWTEDLWDTINKLNTEEFLRFWLEFGFLSNKDKNKRGYDSKNKEYIFVKDFDTYVDEEDIIFLKGSIKERLNKLEKEGFKFED